MSTPREPGSAASAAQPMGNVAASRAFTAILTRPAGQSAPLAAMLAQGGVDVIDFPLIAIAPADDVAPLEALINTIRTQSQAYRLVFFVSPNAVAHAFAYAASQGVDLAATWAIRPTSSPAVETLIATVGPGTLLALARHGIHAGSHRLVFPDDADTVAAAMRAGDATHASDAVRFDSEALVAALDRIVPRERWAGERVLIVRGDGGREWFGDLLRESGAQVEAVCAYRRTLPTPDASAWRAVESLLDVAAPSAWALGSSEAVRNLRALAEAHFGDGPRLRSLLRMPVLAPHPRIARAAESAGFDTIWHPGAGDLNLARAIFAASERLTKKQNTDGMTEEKTGNTAAAAASTGATSAAPASQAASAKRAGTSGASSDAGGNPTGKGGGHAGMVGLLWLVVIVAVGGAVAGGWWLNARFTRDLNDVRAHQASGDAALTDAQQKSAESLRATQALNGQLSALSGKVSDTQTQQQALQQMYQDLAHNHDDWVMTQASQTLSSANQQLQLTGDVHMALYALQNADNELATSSAPQVLDVRRAIAADIDKLKSVQVVDVPGLALRLDQAIGKIDALPLSGDVAPQAAASEAVVTAAPTTSAASASAASDPAVAPWYKGGLFTAAFWQSAWAKLTHHAGDSASRMVSIRRIDRASADAMLIAPDQDAYLRQNVTLRLLSARLSLLSRDPATMQADLSAADDALAKYFDPSSPAVGQVRTTIASVRSAAQHVDIPTLDGSLEALRQNKSRGG